jgi:uncharacterized Zn finger protein (UPF0148 family)
MNGNDTCEAGHTYPTAESHSQPDKLIDRLTRENADLRAKLAEAEKARDEQAEAVRVLGAALAACNELRKKGRTMTYTTYATKASAFGPLWYAVTNNPTAAAAVKEAGNTSSS